MPKISELAYAGELGAANYILGVRDGVAVRFPIEVFEDEPIVNSSFTVLTDTPANYVDQAGKLAAVNSTETGLEFVDPPEGEYAFTDLTDTPNTYTDQGGKLVKVNSGGTGLEFGNAPASTFLGLSDTPDSYSAYSGKVVAVKADASGLEFVSASGAANPIVDLTSATEDYTLSPGEVAKISYTGATSVPLHIATEEGLYELEVDQPYVLTKSASTAVSLLPNGASYTNSFVFSEIRTDNPVNVGNAAATITGWHRGTSESTFNIGYGYIVSGKYRISTRLTSKSILGQLIRLDGTTAPLLMQSEIFASIWKDTTTQWSSLGTLSLGVACSGTIVIKRIA